VIHALAAGAASFRHPVARLNDDDLRARARLGQGHTSHINSTNKDAAKMTANTSGVLGFIGAACTLANAASAATLKVPQQYAAIQAAVDAAQEGDTVRVAPGTYTEHLLIQGKAITLAGAGANQTIIDAQGTGRHVTIYQTGAGQVTVSGFTLRNGNGNAGIFPSIGFDHGGAVYAQNANIAIRNNVIRDNHGCLGTAIDALEATVVLTRNRIEHNLALPPDCGQQAVIIRGNQGAPSIVSGNVIQDHDVTALILQSAGQVTVSNNIFRNNVVNTPTYGGEYAALISVSTQLTLTGNLFTGNVGVIGAALITDFLGGVLRVANNSFVSNTGETEPSALHFVGSGVTEYIIQNNRFDESPDRPAVRCDGPGSIAIDQSNIFAADPATAIADTCVTP
jgi:parallel beta helix pectate lyase-like protein